MPERPRSIIFDGLAFPGCPRWHAGALWFVDRHEGQVVTMRGPNDATVAAEVPGGAAGLGWLPDGTLVVGAAAERTVLALRGDSLEPLVHLRDFGTFPLNDLTVSPAGRLYTTDYGTDPAGGEAPVPTAMICLEALDDGWDAWVVLDELQVPDGSVFTADGSELIVAEAMAQRLDVYPVHDDGSLGEGSVFAEVAPNLAAGPTVDSEGAVWACDPLNSGVMRAVRGVGALDWIPLEQPAFGCALGGPSGRTLFVCTAATSDPSETSTARSGRIEAIQVEVPAAT